MMRDEVSRRSVEARLRRAMLALAVAGAVGALVELVLTQHTEGVMQWVPFGLSILALGLLAWLHLRPTWASVLSVRRGMPLLLLGSLIGMWQHFEGNLALEAEVKPQITGLARAWNALFGANPLLAPGLLAMVGLLAMAATIAHPASVREET
jgi:hypothetical protein